MPTDCHGWDTPPHAPGPAKLTPVWMRGSGPDDYGKVIDLCAGCLAELQADHSVPGSSYQVLEVRE